MEKRKMNKKGQLEIGVTMMVLLVFFILLMISMIFYFRFAHEAIKGTKEDILELRYSGLLNMLMNAPEFKCSVNAAEKECLDAIKLLGFKELINDNQVRDYYSNIIGDLRMINVEIVYPEASNGECDIITYPECNTFLIYGSSDPSIEGMIYSIPVAIYYPDIREYRIGKLRIKGEI